MGWNKPENYVNGFEAFRAATGQRWLMEWHEFIDHLIKGGSIESFFQQFNL